MSRVIHKFLLEFGESRIEMPEFAKPLHVGEQNGLLYLWAAVDQADEKQKYRVRVIGTGHVLPVDLRLHQYVGTVQMLDGLVWHVFVDS